MNTHLAIKTGNITLIMERIETRQIHTSYKFGGLSALHLAVMYGQTKIVHLLLNAGADVNSAAIYGASSRFDIKGNTPVDLAVEFDKLDILRALLKSGGKVSDTSVHLAVQFHRLDILRALLEAGGKVSDQHLILAVQQENLEVVKCLLEKVEWKKETYTINKIFTSIVDHNNCELLKLFVKPELIDANTLLTSGESLLYHSAEVDKLEISQVLIERGAAVDFAFPVKISTSNRGNKCYKDTSVLSVATSTGNYELVKLLLDKGATPDGYFSDEPRTKGIQTKDIPIVIAVENNFIDIVSLLIDADADIYVMQDGSESYSYNSNKTLFGIAVNKQLLDIVKLLIESAGADLNNKFHSGGNLFKSTVETKNEELILYLLKEGVVAAQYLVPDGWCFFNMEDKERVNRLYEEAKVLIYTNNTQVLAKFFIYLSTDKNSIISKLPEDIRKCIIHYTAIDNQKLNSSTFENYMRYQTIEYNNNLIEEAILGQVTCEEIN